METPLSWQADADLVALLRRYYQGEAALWDAIQAAVQRALEPCRWANLNAALQLHESGADEADVQAYLERWGLMTPELAAHLVRFLQEPTSRSYIITYLAGRGLARSWVGSDPARFRRLLTEQVRVGELIAGTPDDITPP